MFVYTVFLLPYLAVGFCSVSFSHWSHCHLLQRLRVPVPEQGMRSQEGFQLNYVGIVLFFFVVFFNFVASERAGESVVPPAVC